MLQEKIRTPILDLRDELRKVLIKGKTKAALILGTHMIVRKGLYRFKDIKSFEPNNKELKELTNVVFKFNKGENKQKQVKKAKHICQKYINKGAEIVILGCTELALMLADEKIKTINTIDVLVEATIKRFCSKI